MKRHAAGYPGVFYRLADRISGRGKERVYYVRYKKDGKLLEEKVGRQYADDMSPAKANRIRSALIDGKRLSRPEKREAAKAVTEAWTIKKIWDEYKKNHADLKGLVQDECRFRLHIDSNFGMKEPSALLPLDITRIRIKLLKTMKPATVRNILELLRRLISYAEKNKLCKPSGLLIEMPTVNNIKTEDLTADQLNALLIALDQSEDQVAANLMRLALYSGMRAGEILALKWADIDFTKAFISIRNPKGGTDRKIPLNTATRAVLDSIGRPSETDEKTSEYVFPGKEGQHLNYIPKAVNLIKTAAGLPEGFRALHGLRHFFATTLAASGQVDMFTLQKLLTHKSPMMTQRYAHMRDSTLQNASNLVGELMKKKEAQNPAEQRRRPHKNAVCQTNP
jgi:integrase